MADRIAKFNCRITFQKNDVIIDEYQNHTNAWTDYFTCSAYADTYVIDEDGNEVKNEERSTMFHVRYCPELACVTSTGYRILFDGGRYNIISVDMMNYQRREIRFSCRREKR